jgi:hypothetical protein
VPRVAPYLSSLIALLGLATAVAHDNFPPRTVVNPAVKESDRKNAKLNFLQSQGNRAGVDSESIQAARGIFYKQYLWLKTRLRVCFWNGSRQEQQEVIRIAGVWHEALPSLELVSSENGVPRQCAVQDLSDFRRMSDIRINLNGRDPRPLWNPKSGDDPNGDWSYPGRSVAENPTYPTTMNLVSSMRLRAASQMTDYYFNVRHEFGHALGLVHEHQRSVCEGWFNIEAIAKETGWAPEVAQAQVGALGDTSNQYGIFGAYDINSIMQYNFAPSWYQPDRPGKPNPCRRKDAISDLSEMDKVVIAYLYEPTLNEAPQRRALIAAQKAIGERQAAAALAAAPAAPEMRLSVEAALIDFGLTLGKPERISIQVFPHPVDRDVVLKTVATLGYPLQDRTGRPIRTVSNNVTRFLQGDPTNAVLYTPDVSEQDARYVALSLLNAGIKVKSVQQYFPSINNRFTKRSNLIQIGAAELNRNREPLSRVDILTKPLPIFGVAVR